MRRRGTHATHQYPRTHQCSAVKMKFMVAALLLAAACQAEVARSKQKEDSRTDKRAPERSIVEKRAPILPTVVPSATPGIEYADSKDSQTEKTPAQIYARLEPQVAKISDVLTGRDPGQFPAAIASHLYSPLPVYQPRLSSPTIYEISAPVPSQLAYSEHKIAYQPPQNAIQFTPQEYNQKLSNPKQAIARLTVNYQPYPQQLLVQHQPIVYSQQQPEPILQQIPVYQPQPYNQQPIQYSQAPQVFQRQQTYQQPLIQLVQAQPGITYAEQEKNQEQTHQRPAQRELKTGQPEAVKALEEKANPQPQQNIAQPQGAVSYASFSVGAPAASSTQPQYQQQQQSLQQQYRQHQQPPQQYQQPAQQYEPQYQQIQYQPAIQYQPQQHQVQQYQPAPQRQIISKPETQNLIAIPVKPNQRQISYFRQGPLPVQPYQPQAYQGQESPAYQAAAPHFPPVQYFGKFAHSIFGQYQ